MISIAVAKSRSPTGQIRFDNLTFAVAANLQFHRRVKLGFGELVDQFLGRANASITDIHSGISSPRRESRRMFPPRLPPRK